MHMLRYKFAEDVSQLLTTYSPSSEIVSPRPITPVTLATNTPVYAMPRLRKSNNSHHPSANTYSINRVSQQCQAVGKDQSVAFVGIRVMWCSVPSVEHGIYSDAFLIKTPRLRANIHRNKHGTWHCQLPFY